MDRWTWFWICRGYAELDSNRYRFSWDRNWQYDLEWHKENRYGYDYY